MVNQSFFSWLNQLSKHPSFIACTSLSDSAMEERYDLDLIVRFLVLRKLSDIELKSIGDLNDFLDDGIVSMATDKKFNRKLEETNFKNTFDMLETAMSPQSENCFRRFESVAGKFKGGFLISGFEAVALGIGSNLDTLTLANRKSLAKKLPGLIKEIWSNQSFKQNSGSGVRASTKIPVSLDVGRKIFRV